MPSVEDLKRELLSFFFFFFFLFFCSNDREIGGMESAHDSAVWALAWHPIGHMLVSGSNDYTRYALGLGEGEHGHGSAHF